MTPTLRVKIGAADREVTWAGPSEIAGDQTAADFLEWAAEAWEGSPVGRPGMAIEEDYLDTPLGFFFLAEEVFDEAEPVDWDPFAEVRADEELAPEDAVF